MSALPELGLKVVAYQYHKYFYAVFQHFRAARNDARRCQWLYSCQQVYYFWARRWWDLHPQYFYRKYPESRYWHEGTFMWEVIISDEMSDFPDGDTQSTLMEYYVADKYHWWRPVKIISGFCNQQSLCQNAIQYTYPQAFIHVKPRPTPFDPYPVIYEGARMPYGGGSWVR